MDLRVDPPPLGLRGEYIHREFDHGLTHWIDAGRRCQRTGGPTARGLAGQRALHRELLAGHYGEGVLRWMPDVL